MYTLKNRNGLEAEVLPRGGIIRSLLVPGRGGRVADVVLGHDRVEDYGRNPAYLGALIGRYANRIGGGRFSLNGRSFSLSRNNGGNHLHGGERGFHDVDWQVRALPASAGDSLELTHTSPDGADGYPGRLSVTVSYTLTQANELIVDWRATTDAATPVNFTQHSYFNLAGHDAGDVLDHVLEIDADRFLPVDATLIPTGELRDVRGTPFDFRTPAAIGTRIAADDEQLRIGRGYDHCLVLQGGALRDGDPVNPLRFAARLSEPLSGRTLEVYTSEPGMQLYTGNHLDVAGGKGGARYGRHAGVALETQHFPDSPNHPEFPNTLLEPGEEYRSRTVYAFATA